MSENRIGTCLVCGGPVVVYPALASFTPFCRLCGVIARQPSGPIVPTLWVRPEPSAIVQLVLPLGPPKLPL